MLRIQLSYDNNRKGQLVSDWLDFAQVADGLPEVDGKSVIIPRLELELLLERVRQQGKSLDLFIYEEPM